MADDCRPLDMVGGKPAREIIDCARDQPVACARRAAGETVDVDEDQPVILADRGGELVEYGKTSDIFTNPREQRTQDYITGRYG